MSNFSSSYAEDYYDQSSNMCVDPMAGSYAEQSLANEDSISDWDFQEEQSEYDHTTFHEHEDLVAETTTQYQPQTTDSLKISH